MKAMLPIPFSHFQLRRWAAVYANTHAEQEDLPVGQRQVGEVVEVPHMVRPQPAGVKARAHVDAPLCNLLFVL